VPRDKALELVLERLVRWLVSALDLAQRQAERFGALDEADPLNVRRPTEPGATMRL
jgi:hypothetical protein